MKASLACNVDPNKVPAEDEFFTKFPSTVIPYIETMEKEMEELKRVIDNLVKRDFNDCKTLWQELYYDPIVFEIVIATLATGIYECEKDEKCTLNLIGNKNLLIGNIRTMLTNGDAKEKLKNSCKQESIDQAQCEKAREELNDQDGFESKGFQEQKSTLAILTKALSLEMANTYKTLRKQNIPCGRRIASCTGINLFFFILSLHIKLLYFMSSSGH